VTVTPDPLFHVEHLWLAYPARRAQPAMPVLADVSFEVERNTSLTLIGPSGSGKSTLLRCLLRRYLL
jgi:ABC-type oligopeptide transport system ATPase subunit